MGPRKLVLGSVAAAIVGLSGVTLAAWLEYRGITPGPLFYVPHPTLGYEVAASARQGGEWLWEITDEIGARTGEHRLPQAGPPIVLAGCSFTWGMGVPWEHTFGAVLEKMIRRPVINLGVSGYGTVGARLRLQDRRTLRPQTVIYTLIPAHLGRNVQPCAASGGRLCLAVPHYRFDGGRPSLVPPLSHDWYSLEAIEKTIPEFGPGNITRWIRRHLRRLSGHTPQGLSASVDEADQLSAFEEEMKAWSKSAQEEGYRLVVAWVPLMDKLETMPHDVKTILKKYSVSSVDLSQSLREVASRCVSPQDCHPGRAAHEAMARELAINPEIRLTYFGSEVAMQKTARAE